MNISATDLARIGETLYGTQWKVKMARDLGFSYRTVRRWEKNEYQVPEWAIRALFKRAQKKRKEVQEIESFLQNFVA